MTPASPSAPQDPHPAVKKADELAALLRRHLGHPAPLAWEAEQLARKVRQHFEGGST